MATSATPAARARARKSTGVRLSAVHVTLMRAYFATLGRVSPRIADRHAALLFCWPRRLRHYDVPAIPARARQQLIPFGSKGLRTWTWGEGPRVLLAHGWEGTARDMVPLATTLAGRGRSVTVFDMPAHGSSGGRTTTLAEMADAVGAVARATGTPDAVVGHSLGGAAALLALRDGLGASAVALLASPADPALYLRRLAELLAFSEERYDGLRQAVERRAGASIDALNGATVARSLTARALILHDPADRQVPFTHGEAIANAWRGATLHPLQGLGHRRPLYDADVIARVSRHIVG